MPEKPPALATSDRTLSLYHLLNPTVLADPYPLYARLRQVDPVHWDPLLHAWVVTSYADVVTVLHRFSAARTPTPQQLVDLGLESLSPLAEVMVRQMLFLDPPAHTRLRELVAKAFTPQRIASMGTHIQEVADRLVDAVLPRGEVELMADIATPLPAIVTAEMLGVPISACDQLKQWSADFAEVLGNFQHNPERSARMLQSLSEMTAFFRQALREQRRHPQDGLISALLVAEQQGDHLSDDEIIANLILTMVGGLETTTNLIGNGMLSLFRYPAQLAELRADRSLIPSAVEELLRFESPSQHTARLAPEDLELGGKRIRKRQAVIAVMGAANRDPARFPEPDRLDLHRQNNRHVAFGWASHYCFGAALGRMQGQIVFETLLRRLPGLTMLPGSVVWRKNLGLRGLTALPLTFERTDESQRRHAPDTIPTASSATDELASVPESRCPYRHSERSQ